MGRPRAKVRATFGRVGGQGGGHRRLLESDRNWQESDNASRTPCTPKGGGGFKGSAVPADPLKEYGVWYTMTFDRFGRVGGVWQQGGSEGRFREASV